MCRSPFNVLRRLYSPHLGQNGVQHWHVCLLRLNSVREETVSLVRYEEIDRGLFHTKYDARFAYVLLNYRAGVHVRLEQDSFSAKARYYSKSE